ncbi:MAG: amino acid ABC transporter permease [Deltaproteobacteria bacterium]|nr:amino acid ABC transporter permease [Deltaproteobacteria bacterium]MBW2121682.1 amino acid ABC transporter permease [Deltaproteobacteria bacterium]
MLGLAYEFDWSVLWRQPYGMYLLQGIWLTIQLGILSWIIAFLLGVFIGTIRVSSWRSMRFIGTAYVEIFRNIPFLVQLFFWYYAGPMVFGQTIQYRINAIPNLNYYVAIIALGMYTASRVAEHTRAGFAAISRDQYQAALSTGLTRIQMYRYVIIPYALRVIIPPLTTEFLTIFKNSSIAMTIGVAETTFMAYRIDAETFHGLEATTGACLIYLALGLGVVKLMGVLESRFKIHGLIGR